MSVTNEVRTAVGASDAPRPIVLTIDCDTQRYLNSHNGILAAMFGTRLIRLDATLNQAGDARDLLPPAYVYPDDEGSLLRLLKEYPEKGITAINELLESSGMKNRVQRELEDAIRPSLSDDGLTIATWREAVKVVLISPRLTAPGSRLQSYLPEIFPQALFYEAAKFPEQARLIWHKDAPALAPSVEDEQDRGSAKVPRCFTCGNKIRPVGPGAYVCESCGTTRGLDPTDNVDP